MNNNPPFAIGQKVVVIKGPNWGPIKKGQIVEVATMLPCKCSVWFVGLADQYFPGGFATCNDCGYIHTISDYRGGPHYCFAPIETNYADATSEILEKFKQTDEQPDKVLLPEKVTV